MVSPSWLDTIIDAVEITVSIPRHASSNERRFLRSPWTNSTPMCARCANRSAFDVGRTSARTGCPTPRSWRQISPPKPTGPVAPTTGFIDLSSFVSAVGRGHLRSVSQTQLRPHHPRQSLARIIRLGTAPAHHLETVQHLREHIDLTSTPASLARSANIRLSSRRASSPPAQQSGYSGRYLDRLSKQHVGLSPKVVAEIF